MFFFEIPETLTNVTQKIPEIQKNLRISIKNPGIWEKNPGISRLRSRKQRLRVWELLRCLLNTLQFIKFYGLLIGIIKYLVAVFKFKQMYVCIFEELCE